MSGLLEQAVVKESKYILLFPVIKKNDQRYATEHVWYSLLVAILKFR